MTVILLGIGLLIAVSQLLGWYFRTAEAGTIEAKKIWKRLSANLNLLIVDDGVPDRVARDLTVFASIAGCGCFAGNVGLFMLRKSMGKPVRSDAALAEAVKSMTAPQRNLMKAVLSDLILIDAMAKPIVGWLLHTCIKHSELVKQESDERLKVKDVSKTMALAREAAVRKHAFDNFRTDGALALAA